MLKKYTPEQIDKILESLPEELKDALFSMETADIIWQACEKQNLIDERMTKIAKYTGHVLMGLLLPQEFQEKLEKEIKLPKKVAEEINREINRFVFYPVKPLLEELYKIEIAPPAKPTGISPPPEEKPLESTKEDVYREPIE